MTADTAPAARQPGRPSWTRARLRAHPLQRLARNPRGVVGTGVLLVLGAVAVLAPLVAPAAPDHADFLNRLAAPSAAHLLGTDHLGRDVLSRVIWASRTSLLIGVVSASAAVAFGLLLGGLSGFFGGWVDVAIMRTTDVVLAFPVFFVAVMVLAVFGPSVPALVVVLAATSWPPSARLVRAEFLRLRQREFVVATRALGASNLRIMVRHLLPNVVAVVVISVTLRVGLAILAEASLSYLGLGVQPPTPSWGTIIADGRDYLLTGWWISLFPGVFVLLAVLAFNLVGDGIRDAFDPKMQV
ncbi:MAG TPA: ABC transporter permease [bacterium]|nr:ABC transporter permease [bacterium]